MKHKLSPDTCYMAGLFSKSANDRNAVGIVTGLDEVEQRFVQIAIKDFGILPQKVLIEQAGERRRIFFYHSRIMKQLNEIATHEERIFRERNALSASYLAGIFDAAGSLRKNGAYINGLTPKDEVMLANLGIHTRDQRILNVSSFIELVNGSSYLLQKSIG